LRNQGLSPEVSPYPIPRALLKSTGFTGPDLGKPLVAVANIRNEILPGSCHLQPFNRGCHRGRAIGVLIASPCRDLVAASVEMMIEHASYGARHDDRHLR